MLLLKYHTPCRYTKNLKPESLCIIVIKVKHYVLVYNTLKKFDPCTKDIKKANPF